MTVDVEAWLVGKMAERMVQLKAEHERVADRLLAMGARLSVNRPQGWASHDCALLRDAARLLRGAIFERDGK